MKKNLLVVVCIFCTQVMNGQSVAINSTGTAANSSAMLDVSSTTKGLLIPRMTNAQINAIVGPANGLIVFNTTSNQLSVNTGTPPSPTWQAVGLSGWGLTGNGGTTPGTNFIGTTDNLRLVFRTNNIFSGAIDPINHNTFFGYQAGNNNGAGGRNIGLGTAALFSNQNRSYLIAIGDSALYNNNGGSGYNVALGSKAGFNTASGYSNIFIGRTAGFSNETGFSNTVIGNSALYLGVADENNVAIGNGAIYNGGYTGNPARRKNVAVGDSALHSLYYSGDGNVAIGYKAAYGAGYGSYNIAIGFEALGDPQFSPTFNIAVGYQSMYASYPGARSIGIGYRTLYYNEGANNIAIGDSALLSNIDGLDNIAVGEGAAESNESGDYNVAIGHNALTSNSNSGFNIAIGDSALLSKDGGTGRNTVVGSKAGYSTTTGAYNCFYGRDAASLNTTGSYNVAIGHEAMDGTINSEGNVIIGREASSHWDLGNNNTMIGSFSAADADGYSNSVGIGYLNVITASNQVRLGWAFTTSIGGYQNWSNISDGRFKKNIQYNVPGLDFIMELQPVTYNLDAQGLQDRLLKNTSEGKLEIQHRESFIQTGFVAQDVETVARKLGYSFSGVDAPKNATDLYGLRYAEFVVPLVKAVQEQQQLIGDQRKTISKLEQQNIEMQKQLTEIKRKLGLE